MGEKDIAEKILMDNDDVFADVVNGLIFDGKPIIEEINLSNVKDKSQYKISGKIHEQERDVAKVIECDGVKVMYVGIENQTDIDADETIRVIGYDVTSYRGQLLGENEKKYPVITLVLYFGERKWSRNKTLYETLNILDNIKPFVNDYKINVFEIAYMTSKEVEKFTSDFKIVADYFVQKRMKRDYKPINKAIKHVDELLKLMTVLTGDSRFEEQIKEMHKEEGEVKMCEVLDKIENRGIEIGETRGRKIGEKLGEVKALYFYMKKTPDEIGKIINMDEAEVMSVIKEIEKRKDI
ncbi:MAG: Rpn family recombination-promoting nuclease/putative transposase [Lachnospiraceae bacterium]|nr:Rpn family recombination-promoting nuclease/putative transposase [Lachnospiraceae bacterium]